jgi:hypothetical protein
LKIKEESAFYKHIAQAHSDLYIEGDELEKHFNFEVLKVFKFPLDREVDEGVRMVLHRGVIINSKTEWFSPSIVRTTLEKGGAEMAHQPVRGFRQVNHRDQPSNTSQPSSTSHPGGKSAPSHQPSLRKSQSSNTSHPGGSSGPSHQPSQRRIQDQVPTSTSQPPGPGPASLQDQRMRNREIRRGTQ